ncbi:DUF2637 domain-containing protein [Actinoplanes sp. NPDC049668]|uniref:DUF2637 domain-containing protein n=1 Tax=unclassified Actinoplanes TaxID=2626549 RepID=UPI0033B7DC70
MPKAGHPGRFPPAAKVIHDVLGWLLAASATLLAASGQVEYAIAADITDLRRFLVPAILEIAAIFLILGGYLRACDGDNPALLWLLAAGVASFATWTNLTHGGPRAGRIYAAATVVTFVLWLLKLRDRYRATRRANGLIDAPTAKFRLIRWAVMPRLTCRAWLLAIEYNLRDTDEALRRARLWHDTARDTHTATTGTARARRATANRAAELAVRRAHMGTDPTTFAATSPPTTEQTAPLLMARADERYQVTGSQASNRRRTAKARRGAAIGIDGDRLARLEEHSPIPTRDAADCRLPPPIADRRDNDRSDVLTAISPHATTECPKQPAWSEEPTAVGSPEFYRPTSDIDAVMYRTWLRGVEIGHEPTGAELARTAGRPDDSTGTGRRAVRRYRDAHAAYSTSAGQLVTAAPCHTTQLHAGPPN